MEIGNRVRLMAAEGSFYKRCEWFPAEGLIGEVSAVFKNGSIRVALEAFRNHSEDGKLSKVFGKNDVVVVPL